MIKFARKLSYTISDIAEICSVTPQRVRGWVESAEIEYYRIPGGHYRFYHADVVRYLEAKGYEMPEEWQGPPRRFRVLLVEDDADLLEIFVELLKDEPRIDVKAESNGFMAGLQIAGWKPDLILLDFLMPGVNGFEICSRLRENESTMDMPVLAITSLTTPECRQAVYDSGVSDFLGKPFHSEALLEKVRTLLGIGPSA